MINNELGVIPKLSLWQKLILKVNGNVFIHWIKPHGYSDYVPVYLVKCKKHNFFLDTPHGFNGELRCSKCEENIRLFLEEKEK